MTIGLFTLLTAVNMVTTHAANYTWMTESFDKRSIVNFKRGQIVEFTNKEGFCGSYILIPGVALLPDGLLGFAYFLALCYLFLGISVVSDIFMEGIGVITSKKSKIKVKHPVTGVEKEKVVLVWNPTIANLSLMALGSSAPEILLSVIETVTTLGETPGELGPSTIVGSAAFNLMVISAISIIAINPESEKVKEERDETLPCGVKKINDTGVFAITASFSLLAYIWLFLVLAVISPNVVEIWEAWLTLAMFLVLMLLAYIADRCKAKSDSKVNEEAEKKAA